MESRGFSKRIATLIVLPPLVVMVPMAFAFLTTVTQLAADTRWALGVSAVLAYGAGAAALAVVLYPRIRGVETASAESTSLATSRCLAATELGSLVLWVGWGGVLAAFGAVTVMPSLRGLQYFGEAALIVAAPAMAWSYWASKAMLLSVVGEQEVQYVGRVYSIGVKIGMVFIGFFIVSTGALVLLVSAKVVGELERAGLTATNIAADVTRYGLLVAIVTAVVFGAATYFLARDITGPLKAMIRTAGEMAEGRFVGDGRVFSDDEIGGLADRLRLTRGSLRSLIARVGSSGADITEYAGSLSAGTLTLLNAVQEQRNAAADAATAVVSVRAEAGSVLEAVEKVSDSCYDSAGRAVELNASSTEVAHRMDDLFQSVEKTSSSTMQMDATARQTSGRTSDLAAVSSEVLGFVAEMDATVEAISRTAMATAEISKEVREDAAAGRRAVDNTVAGIRTAQDSTRRTAGAFGALQKSLGDIDTILAFIDELTDRTNLLSLNAAIIAAQAGENDFGFSVIADEVRQLADRTRNATKDIASIIHNVQPVMQEATSAIDEGVTSVDATVRLAQGATEALAKILSSAGRSLDMAASISTSLNEQSIASRHLHEVTTRVSDTIAEIERATAGQAEGTRLLALETERVRDIALQVKRSTEEQMNAGEGIAGAMENIVADIGTIRDRLQHQLDQAGQIANASSVLLDIANRNNSVAEGFTRELQSLTESGERFAEEVAKFQV